MLVTNNAYAQNQCQVPVNSTPLINPGNLYVELTDYATVIPGTANPLWEALEIGFFPETTDINSVAVIDNLIVPRDQVLLLDSNCYNVKVTKRVPTARRLAVRKLRNNIEPEIGEWSALSGPLLFLPALTSPGAVRIGK